MKAHALRCYRVDSGGRRHVGWLLGQRPRRGPRGTRKYFWSNFGPHAALETMPEYGHQRHWIEQYYEEAKGELGWHQFQGRRHDSCHRHAVTVMLSYSFLVCASGMDASRCVGVAVSGLGATRFPPRPDRRRRTIPHVHRAVADWLLQAALRSPIRRLPPLRTYPLQL